MSDPNLPPWGIIIPLHKALVSGKLDLTKDEYTFGTGDSCDYQIFYDSSDPNLDNAIVEQHSEVHFRLEKDDTESETLYYIHDLSEHGTYVNGKKIGKNNKRPLEPNSDISLVSVDNQTFIFIVQMPEDLVDIPNVIKGSYIISKTLGKGAFGKVRLLFTHDGTAKVAMKCVDKMPYSGPTDAEVLRETDIMIKLKHPCIIEIIETHNVPHCLYIIMELAEAGTLSSRLRQLFKLEESVTRIVIHQILLAVEYLHKQGITHRDLKPDNILLASWSREPLIKVTDFGVSKAVNHQTLMKTLAGTPCYIAPEIWKGQILRGDYSNAVDVWSVGIILYQCLIGDLPIRPAGRGQMRHDLMETYTIQTKFDNYAWTKMPLAEDLGRRLLQVEATDRILVKDALKHEWLENEHSQRKVEELTGLALEYSGKAMSERRSSLKEEETLTPQGYPGNHDNAPGPHYHPYHHGDQPFQQNRSREMPGAYPQQPGSPYDNYQNQQALPQPNYPYDPNRRAGRQAEPPYSPRGPIHQEFERPPPSPHFRPIQDQPPYSPIAKAYSPGYQQPDRERAPDPFYRPAQERERAPSPLYRPAQERERAPSPLYRPAQERERAPSPLYRPAQERERAPSPSPSPLYRPAQERERAPSPRFKPYEPERAPSPNQRLHDFERPQSPRNYSPNRYRHNVQARPALDRQRFAPAPERSDVPKPSQQQPAEGIYMSPQDIAKVQMPQEQNEVPRYRSNSACSGDRNFAQQNAGQNTIIAVRESAVITDPEPEQRFFPGRRSSESSDMPIRGLTDQLMHKNYKSQEDMRVPQGPVLTPAPRIKPRGANIRYTAASNSPHRRAIAPRRPLDKFVARGYGGGDVDRSPTRSAAEEEPAAFQFSPKPVQQQLSNDMEHIVNAADSLRIEAKFEKTKRDIEAIHAQKDNANGHQGKQEEASPWQLRENNNHYNLADHYKPVESNANQEIQLYPNLGAARHVPTMYDNQPQNEYQFQPQHEYKVSLDDIKSIQDVIPDYAADVVSKFLIMHQGDKDATINSILHMNNQQ